MKIERLCLFAILAVSVLVLSAGASAAIAAAGGAAGSEYWGGATMIPDTWAAPMFCPGGALDPRDQCGSCVPPCLANLWSDIIGGRQSWWIGAKDCWTAADLHSPLDVGWMKLGALTHRIKHVYAATPTSRRPALSRWA